MTNKDKKVVIGLIVFFFIAGYVIFLVGFKNGEQITSNLARPFGANSWSWSEKQSNLVIYGIGMFGGLWIFIAHLLFIMMIIRSYIFKPENNMESDLKNNQEPLDL